MNVSIKLQRHMFPIVHVATTSIIVLATDTVIMTGIVQAHAHVVILVLA